MGMSECYGTSSEADNLRVLARAVELGCTFWDTADMYGPFTNERLLAKALQGRRDQITLATKFGVSRGEDGSWHGIKGGASYVKACCEASLQRLGTDYIDLYYQHRVDPETPIEETVGAMAELVKAGKVRHLGLSEADPESIARAHAVHPISVLQTEYSLWSRDVEADILPAIRCLQIGFVAYAPLGRGFLAGRSNRAAISSPATGVWCIRASLRRRSLEIVGWSISWLRLPKRWAPRRRKSPWPGCCRAISLSPRYPAPGESLAWRRIGRHKTSRCEGKIWTASIP